MKVKGSRVAAIATATGLLLLLAGAPGGAQQSAAPAPEPATQQPGDWRIEFEAVCGTTDASTAATAAELASLIDRCDKLAERIAGEEETVRRVYSRRLKMCRDLLAFVLESRSAAPQGADTSAP